MVDRAGDGRLLRQIFVHRAGHCAFTPAETITAAQTLLNRLDTGRWDGDALSPGALNAQATALGPAYNIFGSGATVSATAPAFLRYQPTPYLRPFEPSGAVISRAVVRSVELSAGRFSGGAPGKANHNPAKEQKTKAVISAAVTGLAT